MDKIKELLKNLVNVSIYGKLALILIFIACIIGSYFATEIVTDSIKSDYYQRRSTYDAHKALEERENTKIKDDGNY